MFKGTFMKSYKHIVTSTLFLFTINAQASALHDPIQDQIALVKYTHKNLQILGEHSGPNTSSLLHLARIHNHVLLFKDLQHRSAQEIEAALKKINVDTDEAFPSEANYVQCKQNNKEFNQNLITTLNTIIFKYYNSHDQRYLRNNFYSDVYAKIYDMITEPEVASYLIKEVERLDILYRK